MNKFNGGWFFLREQLFPAGCGICGTGLLTKVEAWYGLCDECRQGLVFENGERCDLCGRPLISEIGRCLACRRNMDIEAPAYDRLISLYPYTGKYQKLLGAFKYGRSLGAGHFLSEQLVLALKLLPVMENPVLIPVPPRPNKIHKTGWDQIHALAGLLRQGKGLPLSACLSRQASLVQKKLDRENRRINLKGRIIAKGSVPQNCVLFDDVITTGATMAACAAALKQAGALKVYGVCLFYD